MTSGNTSSSSAASIKGCCCCLVLLFSFLALLSLAVILVIVLAIKPKKPQFDLQQVTVQYINFATTNPPTSASLSLVIRMLFTAKNDNIAAIKRMRVIWLEILRLMIGWGVNAKIRIIGITSPGVQVLLDCAIVISPNKQSLVSKQCGFDGLQV
ncbi:hypothetical protein L1987_55043 [Smallanthus sonchifolius]|uniref:Uncharacterized protein n=1 Tax=Smallanthus sonchifolius TaxID=185202 RepID=A0ACB9E9U9_9ASTR|nr:hypothetical protein L1987_55043 [Smallanthus sonchifolius]